MEDVSIGHVHQIQSDVRERQSWLWHRRLGHPNFGYLKHLRLDFFSNTGLFDLKCNTCIIAKSHQTSYPRSMNKSTLPFALVHSDMWVLPLSRLVLVFIGLSSLLMTVPV